MDLDFLVRRFRQIAPKPATTWDDYRNRQLHTWLRDDVAPVLESLTRRPRFRTQATWPLRTLRAGATSPERALVDKVDAALVAQGKAVRQLARNLHVRGRHQRVAVQDVVATEGVLLGSGCPKVTQQPRDEVDPLAVLIAQVEQIARRDWTDLMCLEDYFEPAGGWMTAQPSGRQAGEFVVALNPELHSGGDFISRCLCRRVELRAAILQDVLDIVGKTVRSSRGRSLKGWEEASQQQRGLTALTEQLRRACLHGDGPALRDACILLTQVHAGLCPDAELGWLDLTQEVIHRGAATMGHRLRNCHGELLERLATSLLTLKKLYTDMDTEQSAIEDAIASGGLVVVRSRRLAYWASAPLDVDWKRHHSLWRFFEALARKAQRGAVVEDRDLYDHATGNSTLATSLSRLRRLIPPALCKHIVANKDPRGYRLQLDRQHIHLFE